MTILIIIILCLIALLSGVLAAHDYGIFTTLPEIDPNPNVPKLVHLIFLPWNSEQRLLEDPLEFDWSPYYRLAEQLPDWKVIMWTLPRLHEFSEKHYPGIWDRAWSSASRPTQIVDLYRWIVVHHHGGVYFQYNSKLNVDPEMLLPSKGKNVRLFTEFVWFSPLLRHLPAWRFPIRQGQPEERTRAMNQIFSAAPKHPYIQLTWQSILNRMEAMKPKCDYDILFIGANAFVSELYEKEGQNRSDVEMLNFWQTRRMVQVSSKGSWRTDRIINKTVI